MNTIKLLYQSILLMTIVLLIVTSCSEEKSSNINPPLTASGSLVKYSDCKSAVPVSSSKIEVSSNEACMDYSYDGKGTLTLKHINAGFNCCPGKIYTDIEIKDGIITITEREKSPMCNCDCLYDIDMVVKNLTPGQYRIIVNEPYLQAGNELFDFSVNLSGAITDKYCVARFGYPWGD